MLVRRIMTLITSMALYSAHGPAGCVESRKKNPGDGQSCACLASSSSQPLGGGGRAGGWVWRGKGPKVSILMTHYKVLFSKIDVFTNLRSPTYWAHRLGLITFFLLDRLHKSSRTLVLLFGYLNAEFRCQLTTIVINESHDYTIFVGVSQYLSENSCTVQELDASLTAFTHKFKHGILAVVSSKYTDHFWSVQGEWGNIPLTPSRRVHWFKKTDIWTLFWI